MRRNYAFQAGRGLRASPDREVRSGTGRLKADAAKPTPGRPYRYAPGDGTSPTGGSQFRAEIFGGIAGLCCYAHDMEVSRSSTGLLGLENAGSVSAQNPRALLQQG